MVSATRLCAPSSKREPDMYSKSIYVALAYCEATKSRWISATQTLLLFSSLAVANVDLCFSLYCRLQDFLHCLLRADLLFIGSDRSIFGVWFPPYFGKMSKCNVEFGIIHNSYRLAQFFQTIINGATTHNCLVITVFPFAIAPYTNLFIRQERILSCCYFFSYLFLLLRYSFS